MYCLVEVAGEIPVLEQLLRESKEKEPLFVLLHLDPGVEISLWEPLADQKLSHLLCRGVSQLEHKE